MGLPEKLPILAFHGGWFFVSNHFFGDCTMWV
jgi:hypothetical protein